MSHEIVILLVCFFITFGFVGYKLFGFIKAGLDKYRKTIEDNINESEVIKMRAIEAIEEAKKREKNLDDEIEKLKKEAKNELDKIQSNFDSKLRKITENMINESKNTAETNSAMIIEEFKKKLINDIEVILKKYTHNLSIEDKNNALYEVINNVNLKTLVNKE